MQTSPLPSPVHAPRLLLTAPASGGGKTTVACALLAALRQRGMRPAAFKCGPDYIDPFYHRAASGGIGHTLDPYFLCGGRLRGHLAARAGEIAVIEGAMGYYDGVAGTEDASAYTVARETKTPAVLLLDAKNSGASLGAVIEGFVRHRPDSGIAGVIFNRAGEGRAAALAQIAGAAGVRSYGVLPWRDDWALPGRYLGLYRPGEIADLDARLDTLGRQAAQTLAVDGLLALAAGAPPLPADMPAAAPAAANAAPVRLAVARDDAFCFLYEENLEMLRALGCEPVFFSPLRDAGLPPGVNGLYLCGGYPELHARALARNTAMRGQIRRAVTGGLPALAEGGGFLYLHDMLEGHAMCGVIGGTARKTARLQRFGYITLTARRDNMLCAAGESFRAHEFRYCESDAAGADFTARKAGRDETWECVCASDTLYAGFPQLFFPACPRIAARFAAQMRKSAATAGAAVPLPAGTNGETQPAASLLAPARPGLSQPADIERRSFELISRELGGLPDGAHAPVILRAIHTTADFEYAASLVFSEHAVDEGIAALRRGATVVTDTNMARAGIDSSRLRALGGEVLCFMADADVALAAERDGVTRARASMDKAAALMAAGGGRPYIFAIGNAPTALLRLCGLAQEAGGFAPALVVGLPVGFVNVLEAKEALRRSGLAYITNTTRKGGSAVAAAVINALLRAT